MKHCKNQLTMLITQSLSNCILEHIDDLIYSPLTEVIQTMTQNGIREHEMRPDLCKCLVRSDVTTFAILGYSCYRLSAILKGKLVYSTFSMNDLDNMTSHKTSLMCAE